MPLFQIPTPAIFILTFCVPGTNAFEKLFFARSSFLPGTFLSSAIIIAHNHPVGDLKPGKQDKEITEKIKEAGNVMGIRLLDHIIFNGKSYYSFVENNEL